MLSCQLKSIRLVASIGVLFIGLLLVAVVSPVTESAADSGGFDVSFPNCGQTLPTSQAVRRHRRGRGGRSFTTNPCLAEQFHWAGSAGRHFEVYVNTSYPAGSTIHRGDNGPKGVCGSDDWACKAYNYGFNNAEFAFHYAQSQYAVADTWWLDVETANSWSDTPALNAQVIQGAVDSLRAHGVLVGIYSIPPMWKEIAGNYAVNLPKWVVQLHESVPAVTYCSAENGFGGGSIALVQVEGQSLDQDVACPGDAFAGTIGLRGLPVDHSPVRRAFRHPRRRLDVLRGFLKRRWRYAIRHLRFHSPRSGPRERPVSDGEPGQPGSLRREGPTRLRPDTCA